MCDVISVVTEFMVDVAGGEDALRWLQGIMCKKQIKKGAT
jgi:hypothetical protein